MTDASRGATSTESDGGSLRSVGGGAAIALAAAYLAIIPLYAFAGTTPTGGEEWLVYLETRAGWWWAILALSVLTDLLFVPVAFALYAALRRADRTLALLGAAFLGLFAVLDLAVTWANYAALLMLSADYAATSDGSQRTALAAAAGYADATLPFSLAVYSIVVPSIGILLLSIVMLRGMFWRVTAIVGIATGALGILATLGSFVVSPLGSAVIVTSLLTIAWLALAGAQLLRRSSAPAGRAAAHDGITDPRRRAS